MSSELVVERKTGLPSFGSSIGLIGASILVSGSLYAVAAPNLSPYLGGIARPAADIPWWPILALRAIEVLGYASSGFSDSKDIIMLSIISRTAYSILLHTTYTIPTFVLIMSIAIDTISIWGPLQILHTADPATKPTVRIDIKKDFTLTAILTLISSSIMGIGLYIAQKTVYPAFVVGHFDAVKNIMPLPLPLFVFGLIPVGYCVQEIIYTHGFSSGAIAMLTSSFVVGSVNIALGVRGGDLLGVFGIVQAWNCILAVASAVLGFILKV
ncbi:protein of unknown function [Taphrina deformans PYCC 5710]|uniref:Uncharacterized protein n=1 Tax=Taphrina deformans (strain PYCC 5710 / ATCC 11124 / CBS 356.35 / IMI 108563 / JCM 9778 / NBRC 8474) TaxID=1097556 RepID=R4XD29_TAPDE|nr:protein of unknown function [Taphrina deformans PYCC 5710]|eukprot:CCG83720.1 protein of unknown function [Taphrina deformans PYCC 5710]